MRKKKEPLAPDFLQIPYQLVADLNLTPLDRMVYSAVYFYSKMRGERCYASNVELARLIFSSVGSIANSLTKLEEHGYIVRGFSDPDTKAKRVEIIPTVAMTKRSRGSLADVPRPPKVGSLDNEPGSSGDEARFITQGTSKNSLKSALKKQETAENKPFIGGQKDQGGSSGDEEIENTIENTIEKIHKEQIFDPTGRVHFGTDPDNVFRTSLGSEEDGLKKDSAAQKTTTPDGNIVNEAIALFLPIVPGDFVGKKTAFAKPPTREAVASVLKRYSLPELKELIRKYDSRKADRFRPEVGTVYEFCTLKLAKIEAYLVKDGALWAQRSISTPEQRADSDKKIQAILAAGREKTRLAKEKWLREHPEEK